MYLITGLAFLLYFFKFPEVVLPGWFDILGSSHQWWHLVTVVCLVYWYSTGLTLAQYKISGGCCKRDNDIFQWSLDEDVSNMACELLWE